jgi:hypothetical protein
MESKLRQLNLVYVLSYNFSKVHFNIILTSDIRFQDISPPKFCTYRTTRLAHGTERRNPRDPSTYNKI